MRYHKIHSQIWNDEKFERLSVFERYTFIYLQTSPHNNLLGIYVLKEGYACEDMKVTPDVLNKDLIKLYESKLIKYDKENKLVWIVNQLKYNQITNPNQIKAAKKTLLELPKSQLILEFLNMHKDLAKHITKIHTKRLAEGLDEGLTEGVVKAHIDRLREEHTEAHQEGLRYTETEAEAEAKTETEKRHTESNEQKTVHSTLCVNFDMPPNSKLEGMYSNAMDNFMHAEHSEGGNGRIAKDDVADVVSDSVGGNHSDTMDHSSDYIPPDDESQVADNSGDNSGGNGQLPKQCDKIKSVTRKSTNRDFVLPDWVPKQSWGDFVEMRKKIRKPLTVAAMWLAVRDLEKLRGKGYDVIEIINQSILNSWSGFFPLKENYKNKQSGGTNSDFHKKHFGLNEKDYAEPYEL